MLNFKKRKGLPTESRSWQIKYSDLEFGETIGKGNYGTVYQGTYFGGEVAIKKITDDDKKYLEREVRLLQDIRHPNVVQLLGICEDKSGLYLVTEYLPGGHLRSKLKGGEPISWNLRIKLALETATAILFLHARQIIHRDLKSKNILIDEHWRVKICDFGLARTADSKPRKMTVCGTEEWLAPEVATGKPYNQGCDVYSFGVILLELIFREKPNANNIQNTALSGVDWPLVLEKLPMDVPPAFLELARRCVEYDPTKRATMAEAQKTLKGLAEQFPYVDTVGTISSSSGSFSSLHSTIGRRDSLSNFASADPPAKPATPTATDVTSTGRPLSGGPPAGRPPATPTATAIAPSNSSATLAVTSAGPVSASTPTATSPHRPLSSSSAPSHHDSTSTDSLPSPTSADGGSGSGGGSGPASPAATAGKRATSQSSGSLSAAAGAGESGGGGGAVEVTKKNDLLDLLRDDKLAQAITHDERKKMEEKDKQIKVIDTDLGRLWVNVVECSDLIAKDILNRKSDPYCRIKVLNQNKSFEICTTVKKSTLSPVWNEEFTFDIAQMRSELYVEVLDEDFLGRDEFLGCAHQRIFPDLDDEQQVTKVIQLESRAGKKDKVKGSIKIKFQYTSITTMDDQTVQSYIKFREYVCQESMLIPYSICLDIKDKRDEVARSLVHIFLSKNDVLRLLKWIIEIEVADTVQETTLFRADSMCTKMMKGIGRLIGLDYVREVIGPCITMVLDQPQRCEIDPAKLTSEQDINANLAYMTKICQSVIDRILESQSLIPALMFEISEELAAIVAKKYPNAKGQAVTGFIFLRFICPALFAPQNWELYVGPKNEVSPPGQRALTLLTKIIQGLANRVMFGEKEQFMIPMNKFIEANQARVASFIEGIYQPGAANKSSATGSYKVAQRMLDGAAGERTVARDLKFIHRHMTNEYNYPNLAASLKLRAPMAEVAFNVENLMKLLPEPSSLSALSTTPQARSKLQPTPQMSSSRSHRNLQGDVSSSGSSGDITSLVSSNGGEGPPPRTSNPPPPPSNNNNNSSSLQTTLTVTTTITTTTDASGTTATSTPAPSTPTGTGSSRPTMAPPKPPGVTTTGKGSVRPSAPPPKPPGGGSVRRPSGGYSNPTCPSCSTKNVAFRLQHRHWICLDCMKQFDSQPPPADLLKTVIEQNRKFWVPDTMSSPPKTPPPPSPVTSAASNNGTAAGATSSSSSSSSSTPTPTTTTTTTTSASSSSSSGGGGGGGASVGGPDDVHPPSDSRRAGSDDPEFVHPAATITYSSMADGHANEAIARQFWAERDPAAAAAAMTSSASSVAPFDVLKHIADYMVAGEIRAEIEADDERRAMMMRLSEEKRAEMEARSKDSSKTLTESGVTSSSSVRVGGKDKKFVRVQVHPSLKTGQEYVSAWIQDDMTYDAFSRSVCEALNKSAPTKFSPDEILLRFYHDGMEKVLGPYTKSPSAVMKDHGGSSDFQFTVKGLNDSDALFAEFLQCGSTEVAATRFAQLRRICGLDKDVKVMAAEAHHFFESLQEKLQGWRGKRLFEHLKELRSSPHLASMPLKNLRVVIVGAGPAGLRTAIEIACAGGSVTILEEEVSGNYGVNVVNLWDCTVEDLKRLAFTVFDPTFAVGHRRVRLQDLHLVLFKIALCLGVNINIGVRFLGMRPPRSPGDRWFAQCEPMLQELQELPFHAVVIADGGFGGSYDVSPRRRIGVDPGADAAATLLTLTVSCGRDKPGQGRECLSLSAANNKELFQSLLDTKGIMLHNFAWLGGSRHQMMMTTTKKVLTERGVLRDGSLVAADMFLSDDNIDADKILQLSKEVMAHFAVEIDIISPPTFSEKGFTFDIKDSSVISAATRSVNIATVFDRSCYTTYVGEALQQSFWLAGTGPNRGYLSAMDCTWSLIQYVDALKERDARKRNEKFVAITNFRENLYFCWANSNPNSLVRASALAAGADGVAVVPSCDPSTRYREIFPFFRG